MLAFSGRELPDGPFRAYTARTITDAQALAREIEQVRARGYAQAVGEREPGLTAIAAPIRSARGELEAIVALQGPSERFDDDAVDAALPLLLERAVARLARARLERLRCPPVRSRNRWRSLYESDELRGPDAPGRARSACTAAGSCLAEDCLYANFVATLDGIVAIPAMPRSNEFIAGDSDADRFLMGLLRAYADAVLIGVGSPAGEPARDLAGRTAIYPPAAGAYRDVPASARCALRSPRWPSLTGSGAVDPEHPVFESRAAGAHERRRRGTARKTVCPRRRRSSHSAPRTRSRPPRSSERCATAGTAASCARRARTRSEACSRTASSTSSSSRRRRFSSGTAGPDRASRVVEGADLTPTAARARLLSVRRHGSHLFTRYALDRA